MPRKFDKNFWGVFLLKHREAHGDKMILIILFFTKSFFLKDCYLCVQT